MPNSNDLAPHGPLSGITVIDLSRILAGPYCTLMLKELGARVIKVESPGIGDDAREYGPFVNGKSAYFQSVNRGKESIALNLKNNDDKNILTGNLDQFHAVTIIQDLVPPKILKTYPTNGGFYDGKDVKKIIIDVEDSISGIEPKEKSFVVKLNGNRLFCAYQPVKKQITYEFERGMNEGDHLIDIIVKDKVGNKTNKSISFTCK